MTQSARHVVVVGPKSPELPVAALRCGAIDYVSYEALESDLAAAVRRVGALEGSRNFVRKRDLLVGESTVIKRALAQIDVATRTTLPVLILGESGTGKELAARLIHFTSIRAKQPFVAFNCGSLASTLAEAELFGALRGSYTGAVRDRDGLFRAANRGSLFLDEIGNTTASVQAALLRALETGEILPVGADLPTKVDVRFISATNATLDPRTNQIGFRPDLFYRLRGVVVQMPPLRERRDDVPALVHHHLTLLSEKAECATPEVSKEVMVRLLRHPWPGNVRELVHVITGAFAMSGGRRITMDDVEAVLHEEIALATPTSTEPPKTYRTAKLDFDRHYARDLLARTDGNMTAAAELAGKSRADFYSLCIRAGIVARRKDT